MDTVELKVRKREKKGKGRARRLRAGGEIPGVVYGKGKHAAPLAVYFADLKKALGSGSNVVLQLNFADASGDEQFAVVKDIQIHPTKPEILVEALPTAVPSVMEIDVSVLGIGDQARIEDMRIPEGVKILNEPEVVVVSILAPEMEEEEEEEELLEGEEGAKAEAGGEED